MRLIVLDVASWQSQEEQSSLPWDRIEHQLLPTVKSAQVCLLVTPEQKTAIPGTLHASVESISVGPPDGPTRAEVVSKLAARQALFVSAQVTHPYERWLPARLAPDAPMGVRFTPTDGLQKYLQSGIVKPLPHVVAPLASLLHRNPDRADDTPSFNDVMALMSLPTSPFELYERMATLCDEREVVQLDRYLRSKLRELVLFDGMDDTAIDAAIERRQLTMRIRLEWARQLSIEATASKQEQRAIKRDAVQAVLGFPPKEVKKEEAQARLGMMSFAEEHTTLAYQVDGEIHILNPDPSQESELQSLPGVYIHKKEERPLPLHEMLDALSGWTLDHYRKDPYLDGLVQRLTDGATDALVYKYARAYIGYLGFPPPSPLPRPLHDWHSALRQMLALEPPAASIRYQYPPPSSSRHGHAIIESARPGDKMHYSPMHCIATPAAAVTLHRGRRYTQVNLSSVQLGYSRDDIFSPGYEYEGMSTEELERESPNERKVRKRAQTPSQRQSIPVVNDELYVEYPFRHAGLGSEYVVFPKIRRTESSVASNNFNEFVKFYQLNAGLKRLSEQLSDRPDGKVSRAMADQLMPQIQKLFRPLQRQYVYFTLREHAPFSLKLHWRAMDRQIGALWLTLRHALEHYEVLHLHDDRGILPVSPGIFVECAVRPVAAGVNLPVEVSLLATQDDLAVKVPKRNGNGAPLFERTGPFRVHPLYSNQHPGQHGFSGIQLPLPLQIIGGGFCAELRFFASPFQMPMVASGVGRATDPVELRKRPTPTPTAPDTEQLEEDDESTVAEEGLGRLLNTEDSDASGDAADSEPTESSPKEQTIAYGLKLPKE